MSRISQTFRRLQREDRKALITFITAGDPSLAETEKLVGVLEKAGADIIELGIPFSDPMADGPVIQASSERALKKGVTLDQILRLIARVRRRSQIPILLMGYYNPVYQKGLRALAIEARRCGVDGFLMVDLPPEEAGDYRREMKKNQLDTVFLLSPTSDSPRVKKVLKASSGFVYYVSLTGVTGARLQMGRPLKEHLSDIRRQSRLPVVVGFGISTPKDVKNLSPMADGIVVGSALVKLIHKFSSALKRNAALHHFISQLRSALDA